MHYGPRFCKRRCLFIWLVVIKEESVSFTAIMLVIFYLVFGRPYKKTPAKGQVHSLAAVSLKVKRQK